MPSEKVHTWGTLAVATLLLPISPLASGGALVGLGVDPDLDQTRAGGRRRIRLTMGMAWAEAWGWYWEPYDRMATHRGLSHVPVIGTAGRLGYLAGGFWPSLLLAPFEDWRRLSLIPVGIAGTVAFWLAVIFGWHLFGLQGLAEAVVGLLAADLAHELMDFCQWTRRETKKWWKRRLRWR